MDTRYRVIISNSNVYKEIPLTDGRESFRIGTAVGDDERFYSDEFGQEWELQLEKTAGGWQLSCLSDAFISLGDARKLLRMELSHGTECEICAQPQTAGGGAESLFAFAFFYDFDREDKIYDGVIDLGGTSKFSIGSVPGCDLVLLDNFPGNDVVEVTCRQDGLEVAVRSRCFGVCHNGKQVDRGCVVRDTDFFSIAHFGFYYKGRQLYVANSQHLMARSLPLRRISESGGSLPYPKFNRSTHFEPEIPTEDIKVLDPEAVPEKPEENLLFSLFPSLASLALVVVLRGFMADGANIAFVLFSVCSMLVGITVSVMNYFRQKKKYQEKVELREKNYQEYIARKKEEIERARETEKGILNREYPSEKESLWLAESFSGDLFDREPESRDFLKVRLGLGSRTAARKVVYSEKEKITPQDPLEMLPAQLGEQYMQVYGVPVISDLRNAGNVGITGSDAARYELLKVMTLDLCTHQYFQAVQLYFFFQPARSRQMGWARFLPHVCGQGGRNLACDEASRTAQLDGLYKELSRRKMAGGKFQGPWLVVFFMDDVRVGQHPVSRFMKEAASLRAHFIFFADNKEQLPLYCGELIGLQDERNGVLRRKDEEGEQSFSFQPISDEQMAALALKLAPVGCEEISLESTLTKNITLFKLLHIFHAPELDLKTRWAQKDICKTMAVPLGVRSKNDVVYMDLHEKAHGPHGLVAGTTGSGKSELLQTYILSMAAQFSPYEVGFVLIDFKGGGMANQFAGLPHLIGAITDIDGKEINRSLLSIRAELDRRKELFAAANVNSINQYIRKYQNKEIAVPLPHLIIIVDEFAELKAEQPEFMKELISASRIGRSLGVHLILATQKPAGQVSDQIWSNSRFRLCLKVQNQADSNEVLHSPLAAEIVEPGRAYLQVGNNEVFELIQTAYSGAPERGGEEDEKERPFVISSVDLAGRRTEVYRRKGKGGDKSARNQLQAMVEYIKEYCRTYGIEKLPNICLPPLPDSLPFPKLEAMQPDPTNLSVEIGIYDAPSSQYQGPIRLQLAGRNTVVIGSSQYGKTNLLQVMIRALAQNYSPRDVNLYILDFGSMFLKNYEALPHVGGVVCASEDERFRNLFKLLGEEMARRKEKLAAAGVSSFLSYREAGYLDLPYIVLLIDNFTALKETYLADDDPLLPLCRDGASMGLSVVIANSQTSGFGYKYFSTISNQLAFTCNDADELSNLFGYTRQRPEAIPGRCLTMIDKALYEAQIYLAFEGKKEIERSTEVRRFVEERKEAYPDVHAKPIPAVPEKLTAQLAYEFAGEADRKEQLALAMDYENISSVLISFREQFMLALLGEKKEAVHGLTAAILSDIRRNIFERKVELILVDSSMREWKEYSDLPYVERYTARPEDLPDLIEELEQELSERAQEVEENGEEALAQFALKLVLINNRRAIECLGASREAMRAYDRIAQNWREMKVLFLITDLANAAATAAGGDFLKRIRDEKKAVIFESLKNVKLFDIPLQAARRNAAPLGKSDAFCLNKDEIVRVKLVEEE